LFVKASENNFFDALLFNSTEYVKFKTVLLDKINQTDYVSLQKDADILDNAIDELSMNKSETSSFFWSDMLPSKGTHTEKTYTFKSGIDSSIYQLSKIYDFKKASYDSVLVYLTRKIDGTVRTIQLIKEIDYVISEVEKTLTITKYLLPNDQITIKEYSQTYGSFVPNTPTKLGLYPVFLPEVVLDTTYQTPTYFIKGHDGSYSRLFGEYNDGYLEDFRDRALLEFEKRVYNRDLGIAGTSDIVSISKNNTFDIADFKTNKRFRFTGITKNDFYLLPPISHLPNCEYFIYSLQLSLYAMLFESMTGLTPGRLTVFWYYRNNTSDYSDLNGEWRVFELPYLKREILDCLDYEKA
jgi:hypothetical protein